MVSMLFCLSLTWEYRRISIKSSGSFDVPGGKEQLGLKKYIAVFLLTLSWLCWAQNRMIEAFIQEGTATTELQTGGLDAAHPNRPIGSKLKVKNPANGTEVEVTIKGRIPASLGRIIDLSPAAAQAIGLRSGGSVVVYAALELPAAAAATGPAIASPLREPAATSSETGFDALAAAPPSAMDASSSGSVTVTPGSRDPMNLTLNIHIENPPAAETPRQEAPKTRNSEDWLAWLNYITAVTQQERKIMVPPQAAPPPLQTAPPLVQAPPPPVPPAQPPPKAAPAQARPQAPQPAVRYTPPPENMVRVIPALPDPADGKLYRLQVETYSSMNSAVRGMQQLRSNGYEAIIEQTGDLYRLSAVDVPSALVRPAVQRLGVLGFREIRVRESQP